MKNGDIMNNQENVFIHLTLKDDLAYQYSVENNDCQNMQMVLRAYDEVFTIEAAEKQLEVARSF